MSIANNRRFQIDSFFRSIKNGSDSQFSKNKLLITEENEKNHKQLVTKTRTHFENEGEIQTNKQKVLQIQQKSQTLKMPQKISHLKMYRSKKSRPLLPLSYEKLIKFFGAVENAMALHYSRNKTFVTFEELKTSVQCQTSKTFNKSDLYHIAGVIPEGIRLKQLKLKENPSGWRYVYKLVVLLIHEFVSDNKKPDFFMDQKIRNSRKEIFFKRLLKFLEKKHDEFLDSNGYERINVSSYNEWHVKFPLDKICLPPAADIPKIQNAEKTCNNDIRDYLKLAQSKLNSENREANIGTHDSLRKGLKTVVDLTKTNRTKRKAISNKINLNSLKNRKIISLKNIETKSTKKLSDRLKGVNVDIIEKIRQKESLLNIIKKSKCNDLKILQELKVLVRTINEIFITSHKTRMPISMLIDQIERFNKKLTTKSSIISQIEYLLSLESKWCVKVGKNNNVFQIDNKFPIKLVFELIDKEIKRLEQCN